MNLSTKILLAIIGVLSLSIILLFFYEQHQLSVQQTAIQTQTIQMQQLADNIARAQGSWATKDDLAAFAKQNDIDLKTIQDNLDKLNASITAINQVTVNSGGQVAGNLPSSNHTPNPTPPNPTGTGPAPDTNGYYANRQVLHLDEQFNTPGSTTSTPVPFGDVGFSAWQAKPWDVNVAPRQYNVSTVLGTDENQKQYAYNKFSITTGGKTYPVTITNSTFEQQYPTPKFSFWNPRLLMGADGGLNITHVQGEFTPGLHLGIISYGQYKTTPDWSIGEVGVGYSVVNKTATVVVTPAAYNIGKNVFSPVMNNTYIGPSVSASTDGSVGVGVGLRVGF